MHQLVRTLQSFPWQQLLRACSWRDVGLLLCSQQLLTKDQEPNKGQFPIRPLGKAGCGILECFITTRKSDFLRSQATASPETTPEVAFLGCKGAENGFPQISSLINTEWQRSSATWSVSDVFKKSCWQYCERSTCLCVVCVFSPEKRSPAVPSATGFG